ncbi:hypothetical protein EMCRGX_G011185 [Ephydatia muelleri]
MYFERTLELVMPSLAYGKLRNYAVRICHMGPFAAKENVAAGVEDSMALEYKKEAAAENEYQLDVERQSYTVYTTV